ncbi:hypothetical protein [Palleronia caenipelagi]|uniref:Mu-like prophage FluMu N-terminal domain-containing protein n=1 Tax=Palleronia caenipelagi TaxID=2489174 RepID=A0A547PW63_9RHOB|nr:hypothetical protein [Palleronia caenipelagi]TRD18389.1 hypothetical protein FEV53_12085 [Palleronia caenipelagi]
MSITHIITAVGLMADQTTFCRAGRVFAATGTPVDREEIGADDWARLEAEPHLQIREATDEEIAASEARPDPLDEQSATALAAMLDEAIRALPAEEFGKDGAPKIPALKKILPADVQARITPDLRDAVWAEMRAAGFAAPNPT